MKRWTVTVVLFIVLSTMVLGSTYAQDDKYVIGNLVMFGVESFEAEMAALGYVEGENITYITPAFDEVPFDKWQEEVVNQAQAMVEAKVDVLVVSNDVHAAAVVAAVGDDTPIVFARSDNPVATGVVADLTRPGGNVTGIATNKNHERRLQILVEIKPDTRKVFYLYTATPDAEAVLQDLSVVAAELGVEVVPALITDPESTLAMIQNTPEDIDWFFQTPYAFLDEASYAALYEVSAARQIGISGFMPMAMPQFVMGYGADLDATAVQAADIVDRILRGGNPADLPVQIAENYLLINLQAAEAIGLEIPESILRQADIILRPGDFEVTETPDS